MNNGILGSERYLNIGNSNGENDDTLVLGAPHTDTKTRVFLGVNSWDFMAEKDLLPSGYD